MDEVREKGKSKGRGSEGVNDLFEQKRLSLQESEVRARDRSEWEGFTWVLCRGCQSCM